VTGFLSPSLVNNRTIRELFGLDLYDTCSRTY